MSDDVCGEPNAKGEPCQRPAGWGTDQDGGPCRDHETDGPVLRKLTPEVKESLIAAIRAGATHEHAAMLAGIAPSTERAWRNLAEEQIEEGKETDLVEFYRRYQQARGAGAVETLRNCSPEFRAQASFGYKKTERVEMDADVNQTNEVELGDDERELALEAIRAVQQQTSGTGEGE